jgi:RNA recognition motif-containing protein
MHARTPYPAQVYIQGMPPGITEKDVAEFFGAIGVVKQDKKTKMPKIWL